MTAAGKHISAIGLPEMSGVVKSSCSFSDLCDRLIGLFWQAIDIETSELKRSSN